MNSIKFVLLSIMLVYNSNLLAQDLNLGKVTISELEETTHPNDTSAVAAFLFKKARTYFKYDANAGFIPIHEFEYKIKIYKKEGLDWANYIIPYYIGYENLNDDSVKFSNAITYNLEGKSINKTKLEKTVVFKKNINSRWSKATITMPNAKVGSVIEFKCTIKTENSFQFPTFKFQEQIPVNKVVYTTEIPQLLVYKAIITGYDKVFSEEKLKDGFQSFQDKYTQLINIAYKQINTNYFAENMPAIESEVYIDNIENYMSTIKHELQKTKFPDQDEKKFADSWEDAAKYIYSDKKFGEELKQLLFTDKVYESILSPNFTETEKVAAILSYVKQTIKWNGDYGYDTKKGVKKALSDKTGNVAEINFALILYLRNANIKANPVLLSTKEHGVAEYPNIGFFNYVIVQAEIDGKKVLLDATKEFSYIDVLPLEALNWTGRLINENGSAEEINLVPQNKSNKIVNVIANITEQGLVTGNVKKNYSDYYAYQYRVGNQNNSNDALIEQLENKYKGIQIENYEVTNLSVFNQPVIESFAFSTSNAIEGIGDSFYFSPFLIFSEFFNPFTRETRKYPIDFIYPKQDKYYLTITIPEGFQVEFIPKNVLIEMPDKIASCKYIITTNGNQLQFQFSFTITQAMMHQDYYLYLKEFFQRIITLQNQKIILKKL